MQWLGFSTRWIHLVMRCIRMVSYAVMVNGQSVGSILPTKGIRLGDPLSPYLFLICAEALSSLLCHAESTRSIIGAPTSKKGPRLSHLFLLTTTYYSARLNLWNDVDW